MTHGQKVTMARDLMARFAHQTGLSPAGNGLRRYLWTDAFAVCNFLELHRLTGEKLYRDLALRLIHQVHTTLGRHRRDDPRSGWISGLDEPSGEHHPTTGGLRIGKRLNERKPGEPFDERMEWDRDGQYYHYLTKWMHALCSAGRATGDSTYTRWAVELARTAHRAFSYVPPAGGPKRMYWKMSIDLSRPQVPSMGHHDPLDGLITYCELQAAAVREAEDTPSLHLSTEIQELAAICRGRNWATDDPLGLGGLLSDGCRLGQLVASGHEQGRDLLRGILDAALVGLPAYAGSRTLTLPADYRLAFRELGLSIGLHAADRLRQVAEGKGAQWDLDSSLLSRLRVLVEYKPWIETIENFWLDPANRDTTAWTDHRDINTVMLATSLIPDGYLNP